MKHSNSQKTRINIQNTPVETARSVAQALAKLVAQHTEKRPFSIALSGGSTPQRLYQMLAQDPFCSEISWEHVAFFFGDERAVPPTSSESNFRMASEALLNHVSSSVYRMEADTENVAGYERALQDNLPANKEGTPAFDLMLLGIGTDGHTASLFPGTAALDEHRRWVVMNDVPQLNTTRMTLTFPVIQAARRVWVIATGESKQPIVKGSLQPDSAQDTPAWPILQVAPKGELVWWLDSAAASTLVQLETNPETIPLNKEQE